MDDIGYPRCRKCDSEMNAHGMCFCSKTENLSFQEACAAIGRGECVEIDSNDYKGCIFGPMGFMNNYNTDWSKDVGMKPHHTYRIVPDPFKQVEQKSSLTYEEALEFEKVRIHWPECFELTDYKAQHADLWWKNTTDKNNKKWSLLAVQCFDLAERRGYRIEKIE